MLAATRPTSFDFPLFLHVLGAMLLVGSLVVVVSTLLYALRPAAGNSVMLPRFAFRTLLFGAIPSWILMRAGAAWIYSKEGFSSDNDPSWVGIGFITSEAGGLVLVIATVLAYLGVRRSRREGDRGTLARVAGVLAALLVVAYVVAVWAMTTKPG